MAAVDQGVLATGGQGLRFSLDRDWEETGCNLGLERAGEFLFNCPEMHVGPLAHMNPLLRDQLFLLGTVYSKCSGQHDAVKAHEILN